MKDQEIKNKIWNSLNKLRADRNFSGFRDTKILEFIGEKFGIEKLDFIFDDKELLLRMVETFSVTAPTYVYNFIEEITKSENNKTLFDPWLTISSPAFYTENKTLNGTCINKTELDIIKTLFKEKSQNIKLGDTLEILSETSEKFDFVVSFPPFGMRTRSINGTKSKFDFATTLILESGKKIENDGKLIFLVSNSFLMDEKGKEELMKKSLFVEAVFSIPSGALAPITNIASNLILVTKNNREKTFVAEISTDENTNISILKNFKNQKEGKALQLGCFVDIKEFKSLNSLVAEKEMNDLVKRIGYPPILLTDISISINTLKGDNSEEVEHLSNSIYLPKVGNSPVVASLSELKIKPKNYYQICISATLPLKP